LPALAICSKSREASLLKFPVFSSLKKAPSLAKTVRFRFHSASRKMKQQFVFTAKILVDKQEKAK
jgi:hypothetical protein